MAQHGIWFKLNLVLKFIKSLGRELFTNNITVCKSPITTTLFANLQKHHRVTTAFTEGLLVSLLLTTNVKF